jgi:excisionase family DNA binding protein
MVDESKGYRELPRVLSIAGFAQQTTLSVPTIKMWIHRGRIAHVKLGRRTVIPRSELDRLFTENLTPALPKREAERAIPTAR